MKATWPRVRMALVEIRVELPSLLSEMYSLLATDAKKA